MEGTKASKGIRGCNWRFFLPGNLNTGRHRRHVLLVSQSHYAHN